MQWALICHSELLVMRCALFILLLSDLSALAQQPAVQPTQLTIYNGDFAVARTAIDLNLRAGSTEVLTTEVTSKLEPDSVVLRDPAGHAVFRVLEQNYDAGVVNQQWLLDKYEGKTLAFRASGPFSAVTSSGEIKTVPEQIVQGRVVRAGHDPLIEVDGHLQFQLPGTPLFPAAESSGLLLKPTLRWQIESERSQELAAELDYITHGMTWQATYNVVLPEDAASPGTEKADVLGWVTLQNNSGTDFPAATVQLMAGDVAKLPEARARFVGGLSQLAAAAAPASPLVTQKTFDDFHLYDLHRTVALRDGEGKQVQFLEASGVTVNRTYVYNGNEGGFYPGSPNLEQDFDNTGNRTVAIREEIRNEEANRLGMPLPAGRLRLYRRESTGQMQFVGESEVQHTPANQRVQLTSGNAFDLTGQRRQTAFHVDQHAHTMDESFEIKLSNAKDQPVTIHAVEHLDRSQNWKLTTHSQGFTQRDSSTIDFPVAVPAKGNTTLTYTVHYSW